MIKELNNNMIYVCDIWRESVTKIGVKKDLINKDKLLTVENIEGYKKQGFIVIVHEEYMSIEEYKNYL